MIHRSVRAAALVSATAALLFTFPAAAHVTLETQEAKVGSFYKAVFRVPHGCKGETMHTLRVRIPDGFYAVKPMPKPGWKLDTVIGPYAQSYPDHGRTLTEGVREVIWSGGNLPDAHYDEFVMRGTLAATLPTDKKLYFPAVQECANGAERWIEIPADGKGSGDTKSPAPGLKLLPGG
jgi:uncharacterized protein YcnI